MHLQDGLIEVKFLVNDLSMAGQFQDSASFQQAVTEIMRIRVHIKQQGYALFCYHGLLSAQVSTGINMQQAVHKWLPKDAQRGWMQWLTRDACWDDQLNDSDEWLEVHDELVTEHAIGQAATDALHGLQRELISFYPSAWLYTPIQVQRLYDDKMNDAISIANYWDLRDIQQSLADKPKAVTSWNDVAADARHRCTQLIFSNNAFDPLQGHPFSPSAAERIRVLLNILDLMKRSFNKDGRRTDRGNELYQEHFTGDKAWFSDSSSSEKHQFKQELTFQQPGVASQSIFCSWHGKIKSPQYRIHFSWPITADAPLYIVYVGPKITRR